MFDGEREQFWLLQLMPMAASGSAPSCTTDARAREIQISGSPLVSC